MHNTLMTFVWEAGQPPTMPGVLRRFGLKGTDLSHMRGLERIAPDLDLYTVALTEPAALRLGAQRRIDIFDMEVMPYGVPANANPQGQRLALCQLA